MTATYRFQGITRTIEDGELLDAIEAFVGDETNSRDEIALEWYRHLHLDWRFEEAGLDAAWEAAVAATPGGMFSPAVEQRAFGRWRAWYRWPSGATPTIDAWGDTEAAALRALEKTIHPEEAPRV